MLLGVPAALALGWLVFCFVGIGLGNPFEMDRAPTVAENIFWWMGVVLGIGVPIVGSVFCARRFLGN